MTPTQAFAVLGAITAFVAVTTWLIDRISSRIDRCRTRRAARSLGHLLDPVQPAAPKRAPRISPMAKLWIAWLAAFLASVLAVSVASADCGEERAAVKLGRDVDAKQVDTKPTDTTIASLTDLPRPAVVPADRRTAVELKTYRLHATIVAYKLESDGDLHIVLSDGTRTLIVEVPSARCAVGGAWASEIAAARLAADQRLHPHRKLKTMVNVPVVVTGPAFWDYVHGQVGHAASGIELHPVVEIAFDGGQS